MLDKNDKRISVIVGHYGSGKSEFSINYAMANVKTGIKTALADVDIANPYFRSREKQAFLEEQGIKFYSNTFNYDITADLPAITARIRAPLEDLNCRTIIDAGGNDSGARILTQFAKYFQPDDTDFFCVINANRFETRTFDTAMYHLKSIEDEIGFKITGLINNTHMLWETQEEDLIKGYNLCSAMSENLNVPIKYNCFIKERNLENKLNLKIFPINMFLREHWQ